LDCGDAVGNNIIVRQNGEYLMLCEVQAIGVSSPELEFISATQKTTGWEGAAERAIDGDTNGLYSHK